MGQNRRDSRLPGGASHGLRRTRCCGIQSQVYDLTGGTAWRVGTKRLEED